MTWRTSEVWLAGVIPEASFNAGREGRCVLTPLERSVTRSSTKILRTLSLSFSLEGRHRLAGGRFVGGSACAALRKSPRGGMTGATRNSRCRDKGTHHLVKVFCWTLTHCVSTVNMVASREHEHPVLGEEGRKAREGGDSERKVTIIVQPDRRGSPEREWPASDRHGNLVAGESGSVEEMRCDRLSNAISRRKNCEFNTPSWGWVPLILPRSDHLVNKPSAVDPTATTGCRSAATVEPFRSLLPITWISVRNVPFLVFGFDMGTCVSGFSSLATASADLRRCGG